MADNKVFDIVTDKIVALLEQDVVPWQQPWDPSIGVPLSLATYKPYRGINPFILGVTAMANGYSSPWWGTYDQLAERSGMVKATVNGRTRWANPDGDDTPRGVRKGEKSTLIVFWSRGTKKVTDEVTGDKVEKRWATLRYFLVFNTDQADNVKLPRKGDDLTPVEPIAACEEAVAEYLANGPNLGHGGDAAYYSPGLDHVQMPLKEAFASPEGYYATLFHELTHSTGNKQRLDREGIKEGHRFGDEVYSKEELIAEMGAAMLCGYCGIEQATIRQSAAYIKSWLRALKDDKKMVVQAAAAAQRACDLILSTAFEAEQAA